MKRTLWAGALALVLLPHAAAACSLCGCGDPLESAGAGLPLAGRFKLGLGWESLSVSAISEDPDRREWLDQLIYQLDLAWDPTDTLSLSARLPYNEKRISALGGVEDPVAKQVSGLGDLVLGARWAFLSDRAPAQRSATWLTLSLGSSINTGATALEDQGVRLDEHDQPGSGAVGPFAGLQLGLERGVWSLSSHVDAQLRATNASGYHYGDALRAGLGIRHEASLFHTVGIALEGRYADYDRDHAAGALLENTGGTVVNLVPSLGLNLGSNVGLMFQAQLPVYQSLFGEQVQGADLKVTTQYLFM